MTQSYLFFLLFNLLFFEHAQLQKLTPPSGHSCASFPQKHKKSVKEKSLKVAIDADPQPLQAELAGKLSARRPETPSRATGLHLSQSDPRNHL